MNFRGTIAFAALLATVSCGTVHEHRQLAQSQNQQLTASVGSTLFRLNKKGDLPNVFGRADLFGGKVDKGFAEVKLRAIHGDGVIELLVYDVNRDSAETTMDRFRPRVDISQTVNVGAAGGEAIPVTIDTKSEREYVAAGVKIHFLEVRPSSVLYTITDLQRR